MICTVTFNPSLDYIVSVDDFQLGMTNRTSSELILPGGKGINVSIVLKNLGLDSTALGYAAGFTGEELIRRLNEFGVNADFIKIDHGMTRINLKLKSIDGTEINGCGPDIDAKALEQLMERLTDWETEMSWYWQEVFLIPCRMTFIREFWREFREEVFSP